MAQYAQETITISNTAVGFDENIYRNKTIILPERVQFVVEGGPIRIRTDGTDPTDTVGYLAEIGDTLTITEETDIRQFKAIRVSADATIYAQYHHGWG